MVPLSTHVFKQMPKPTHRFAVPPNVYTRKPKICMYADPPSVYTRKGGELQSTAATGKLPLAVAVVTTLLFPIVLLII